MLNLLKFRATGDYSNFPDESACSGREAFNRYEKRVAPLIKSLGGRIVFSEGAKGTAIGSQGEQWDKIILVEYPSPQTLGEMLASEQYLSNGHHIAAAVENSRLIPTQANAG